MPKQKTNTVVPARPRQPQPQPHAENPVSDDLPVDETPIPVGATLGELLDKIMLHDLTISEVTLGDLLRRMAHWIAKTPTPSQEDMDNPDWRPRNVPIAEALATALSSPTVVQLADMLPGAIGLDPSYKVFKYGEVEQMAMAQSPTVLIRPRDRRVMVFEAQYENKSTDVKTGSGPANVPRGD